MNVLLIPSELEFETLAKHLPEWRPQMRVCGVGLVAAAAITTSRIAELNPSRVILAGIAGTYDPQRLPVGVAGHFQEVQLEGIGAYGEDGNVLLPTEMGFAQCRDASDVPISELLGLDQREAELSEPAVGRLLSVACASGSRVMAGDRQSRFHAVAEDMEGYAVALAAHLAGSVPVVIIRGISNIAGDRDKRNWDVSSALAAVADKIRQFTP